MVRGGVSGWGGARGDQNGATQEESRNNGRKSCEEEGKKINELLIFH